MYYIDMIAPDEKPEWMLVFYCWCITRTTAPRMATFGYYYTCPASQPQFTPFLSVCFPPLLSWLCFVLPWPVPPTGGGRTGDGSRHVRTGTQPSQIPRTCPWRSGRFANPRPLASWKVVVVYAAGGLVAAWGVSFCLAALSSSASTILSASFFLYVLSERINQNQCM